MKTFDEAISSLIKSEELLIENMLASKDERFANEIWVSCIEGIMIRMSKMMADKKVPPEVTMCSHLHAAFEFGLLVGIEMEKSENV